MGKIVPLQEKNNVPPIGVERFLELMKNKKIMFLFTAIAIAGIAIYISYIAYIAFGSYATAISFTLLLVTTVVFVHHSFNFQKEWEALRTVELPDTVFEERKKQLMEKSKIIYYFGLPAIFIQSFNAITLTYIEVKQPQNVVVARAQVQTKKASGQAKTITPVPEDPDEYIAYERNQSNYRSEKNNDNRAIIHAPNKAEKVAAYIKRFVKVAQAESNKFGIPASIILAQGILESNCGESKLCQASNNHFGIKTFDKSVRHVVFHDDVPTDKFKVYNSAWESYRDHSLLLMKGIYSPCRRHDRKDYRGWAKQLELCGYATDKQYEEKLLDMISKYQLYQYD